MDWAKVLMIPSVQSSGENQGPHDNIHGVWNICAKLVAPELALHIGIVLKSCQQGCQVNSKRENWVVSSSCFVNQDLEDLEVSL